MKLAPRSLIRDPALLLWSLYLITFPIYVFPSGMPQPSGLLLSASGILILSEWNGRLPVPQRRAILALVAFIAYAIASSVLWSMWKGTVSIGLKHGFLLSPFFYIYNGLTFLVVIVFYQRRGDRFLEVTVRAVVIAALIQVPISMVFGRSESLRSTGMFNNPNQFGYYALLSASLILVGQHRARVTTLFATSGLVACGYLALLSASKAALVGVLMISMISLVTRLRTMLISSIVAMGIMFALDPSGSTVDRSMRRITNDRSHQFVEERGYDRIVDHPEYLLLGAGEGGYARFAETSAIGAHELHSSAGTLLFCYGIAGTIIFLVFIAQVLRTARLRQMLMLMPAAAYGLSHQGLRVTLLWVLFAMFVVIGSHDGRVKRPSVKEPGRVR